jgi:hypothetical protein
MYGPIYIVEYTGILSNSYDMACSCIRHYFDMISAFCSHRSTINHIQQH